MPYSLNLISSLLKRMTDFLTIFGFKYIKSNELTTFEYNFIKLNIDSKHPAFDPSQSLVFSDNQLLATHKTGISIEIISKYPNQKLAFYSYGKVFRNDEEDATHSHQFNQLDLVATGNYSVSHLKSLISDLLEYVFEEKLKTRFRPSYFPFTQPSFEVDIFYHNRWIEILGCGLLHPKVMKNAGFSAKKIYGIAAGIGIERLAMVKYGISDIREFYKNDLRFLKQFR
ncbi:hypothetical protein B5M19_01170 [Mesomycoplasma hyopneumoniae]|uniref:phenylalanine--tRNA ligase n=5 Tax=Mesomycoplasma hyopneumoniae TaxID=2099 RepID=A0A223MAD9_MESHO|nr:hypothetical protein [Mesomycoplasma hyopneumoniae]AAZ44356.2 phenylalanyl-tRNA synthetase alpha chain [Mesomycoplasma hyopneumoniae J]AAZ53647.2 phenylalanyl-tRNA synthetase alpha chain [Mesomycoplasma hyopneumoniae 7448]ADQ90503.1 Phenylalanyl-tRNA synthetase alpha chain [Mesomycoplasma hyopneumoniae 168]AGM22073.1 Phenylalanyl-tRNA synthetase alpha chain [Mesomycoplasma hyopneumoniae 168-L]ASU14437.1 Phenylalanine--tRNA ligase alpha subunit [Mesomycoplasma hyopneumoniae]